MDMGIDGDTEGGRRVDGVEGWWACWIAAEEVEVTRKTDPDLDSELSCKADAGADAGATWN